MKDRRSVDDLSIDELERVLAAKKRAVREERLTAYRRSGRALPGHASAGGDVLGALGGAKPKRSWVRRLFDWFLLLVEVGAVVGLVWVLYNGSNLLTELNQEVTNVIAESLPTFTPTPLVTVVVLPSGHTPPDPRTGASQPNESEIPVSLRPRVQAMLPPPIPTQGPTQARQLIISAINVNAPIVQGDSWEPLKKGVGQHIGSADPGQVGNIVLSAHNDIYGEIFRYLDQLAPGDEIQVHTLTQVHTYVVTGTRIVAPTEVSVMAPTDHPSLTLISCYPYLVDNQRIVVKADLKQ